MSRPIVKDPPKGTDLRKMTDVLRAVSGDRETFLEYFLSYKRDESQSEDEERREAEECRIFAAQVRLQEDPRLWAHPREFVRDDLVLPAIANVDGPAVAEALKGTRVLDEFTDLVIDAKKRDTPAHKRQAPPEDISSFVTAIIIGVTYDPSAAGAATPNARHERAARLLGINRHAVRRVDQNFRRRMGGLPEDERRLVLTAISALRNYLESVDLWPSCSSSAKPK